MRVLHMEAKQEQLQDNILKENGSESISAVVKMYMYLKELMILCCDSTFYYRRNNSACFPILAAFAENFLSALSTTVIVDEKTNRLTAESRDANFPQEESAIVS